MKKENNITYSLLFYSLQSVLYLFAVLMILQNQVMGKPFESQDPDEIFQKYSVEEIEPSQAVNETLSARNKRQVHVPISLRTACPGKYKKSPSISSSYPCVETWYYCPKYNVYEAVCRLLSFGCLENIATIGAAKCIAIKESINRGNKTLTITKDCQCA